MKSITRKSVTPFAYSSMGHAFCDVSSCRKRQHGGSMLGTLVMIIALGFVVLCVLKLVPIYLENWQLKSILKSIEEEYSGTQMVASKDDIRIKLAKRMRMDQVNAIDYKTVVLTREDDFLLIDASYESRVPLVANIDVVIKFDDNKAKVPYKRGT